MVEPFLQVMARFDCPAYKLLAGDLHGCQPAGSAEWQLAGRDSSTTRLLRLVWLQGHLRDVSAGGDRATLVDGSGSVLLTGCRAAPGDSRWMEEGGHTLHRHSGEDGTG